MPLKVQRELRLLMKQTEKYDAQLYFCSYAAVYTQNSHLMFTITDTAITMHGFIHHLHHLGMHGGNMQLQTNHNLIKNTQISRTVKLYKILTHPA